MAAARTNQREKCALITRNKDVGRLKSPRSEGPGHKSRKTRPAVAWGGPYGYDFARNWGSSGECQFTAATKPGTSGCAKIRLLGAFMSIHRIFAAALWLGAAMVYGATPNVTMAGSSQSATSSSRERLNK